VTENLSNDGSPAPGAAEATVPDRDAAGERADLSGHHTQGVEPSEAAAVEVTQQLTEQMRKELTDQITKQVTDQVRKDFAEQARKGWGWKRTAIVAAIIAASSGAVVGALTNAVATPAVPRMWTGLWDKYAEQVWVGLHCSVPGVCDDQNQSSGVLTTHVTGDSGGLSSQLAALVQRAVEPNGKTPAQVRETVLSAGQGRDGECNRERVDRLMAAFHAPVATCARAQHDHMLVGFTSKFASSGQPQTLSIPLVSDGAGRHIADPPSNDLLERIRDAHVASFASNPDLPRLVYGAPIAAPTRPMDRAKREEFAGSSRELRRSKPLTAGRRGCDIMLAEAGNAVWLSDDGSDAAKLAEAIGHLQSMTDTPSCAPVIAPALYLMCGVHMVSALQLKTPSVPEDRREVWEAACAKATRDASAVTDPAWRIARLNFAGAVAESGNSERASELFLEVEKICHLHDDNACADQAYRQYKKHQVRIEHKADPALGPKGRGAPEHGVTPHKAKSPSNVGGVRHKAGHRATKHRHHGKSCRWHRSRYSGCEHGRRWLRHHRPPCATRGAHIRYNIHKLSHIHTGWMGTGRRSG
jgi:hypothetical protein